MEEGAMSKRFRETVEVTTGGPTPGHPQPVAFRWRGGTYQVLAVLGHWREDAAYWAGGGVEIPQRDLWRVEARNGTSGRGVYELVHEGAGWRLDRLWD